MAERFTQEIYSDWMKSTQEKKYKEIILDFLLPLGQEVNFQKEKILDVGVGKGWFEKKLFERGIEANVIGIDVERTELSTKGIDFIKGSGSYLPFKESSFKLIVSFDTVHLLKNPKEIERALERGGYALVSIHCNERNFKGKKGKINSMFDLKVLKEGIVGDPREEMSYVALMKKIRQT